MCYLGRELNKEKFIASKNRKCYKIVLSYKGNIDAPFRDFSYMFGTRYKTVCVPEYLSYEDFCDYPNFANYVIFEGFHSFSTLEEVDRDIDTYLSLINKYDSLSSLAIAECTIPKGTIYYEHRGNIVSESIIINKLIRKYSIK